MSFDNAMSREEYFRLIGRGKRNKYHARKVEYDGIVFDSAKEANRYAELSMMEKAGEIHDLQRQVRYELIPAQRDPETGKVLERACSYLADFVYTDNAGKQIVEDAKGIRTDVYKIKRKLMLQKYGIRVREI